MRRGYSILELLIVAAITVVIATTVFLSLGGYRGRKDLDLTAEKAVALLRDAQSRAMRQASSTSWGIHFDNSSTTPSYSLFGGSSYATSAVSGFYRLPNFIIYATATVPSGSSTNIVFTQLTGSASASTSIKFFYTQDANASATIFISSSGAVFY